jgi:bifunctional N-acetylglucosamine-1-phosphate-uridyltransferase/glucosamine-1-phosphate-acetyltransferase GlmU-like protein
VPAAGRGSRLNYTGPKILFPVAGRPILDWLLDFLNPNASRIVLVLSPSGRPLVEQALAKRIPGRHEIVIQEIPTGMGDAVRLGLTAAATPHVAIVWGDQAALRRSSVEACMRLHEGELKPAITCPTVIRRDPYTHFERDDSGRLIALRQAREGDHMPAEGESDAGFFCFRRGVLAQLLKQVRSLPDGRGRRTGEFNLVPVIPLAASQGFTVLTPKLMKLEETIGINNREDANQVENFLTYPHAPSA